ncbi:MAG TPA: multiheme c-type cytochrome, partial [bacterium]|nr:multiheme c-type cytochrome [bacterium]
SYERPNQKWVCGHAAEGKACRVGPDGRGHCVAKAECTPKKNGDRWLCMRPEGACETGPRPDGSCCRPIPPCVPVRSRRALRGTISWGVAAAFFGVLVAITGGGGRGSGGGVRAALLSPGPLSSHHAAAAKDCATCHTAGSESIARVALAGAADVDSSRCLACHEPPTTASTRLAHGVERASLMPTPIPGTTPVATPAVAGTAGMFAATAAGHDAPACAACHPEHRGRGVAPISLGSARCQACHEKTVSGLKDHPEFTTLAGHAAGTHIRFDHLEKTHSRIGCDACHAPSADGGRMTLRGFAGACASCHGGSIVRPDVRGLAADACPAPAAAELVPAPASPAVVTTAAVAFDLIALPAPPTLGAWSTSAGQPRYAPVAHADPVAKHLLETIAASGRAPGPADDGGRCTSCHENRRDGAGHVSVQWEARTRDDDGAARFTRFSHRAHTAQRCESCHRATLAGFSTVSKRDCMPCHTRRGAGETCLTCHAYHAEPFVIRTRPEEAIAGPTACLGCHRHENAFAAWSKSHHATRLTSEERAQDAKAIGDKLGIADVETSPRCAPCHSTLVQGKVVAAVSCESCHGPAREWLGVHADETRADRWDAAAGMGMTRPSNTAGLAARCYGCHVVADEKLVEAGHLGGSSLELATWTQGEVRHGFLDACTRGEVKTNREATPEHKRVLYAVGLLADLDASVRALALAQDAPSLPKDAAPDAKPEAPYFEKMRDRVTKAAAKLAGAVEKEPALGARIAALPRAIDGLALEKTETAAALDRARLLAIADAARAEEAAVAARDGADLAGLDGAMPRRAKGSAFEP